MDTRIKDFDFQSGLSPIKVLYRLLYRGEKIRHNFI